MSNTETMDTEATIIQLIDDEGVEHEFEVLSLFPALGRVYAALVSTEEQDDADEVLDALLVRFASGPDGARIEEIEDEAEYAQVTEEFAKVASSLFPHLDEMEAVGQAPIDLNRHRPN